MTLFKRIVILFILTSVIACVKADKNKVNDANDLQTFSRNESLQVFNNRSLFQTGDISFFDKQFSINESQEADFKEPNQAQIWLKLCGILDRASRGTIRNEKFHISSELGDDVLWNSTDDKVKGRSAQVTNPVMVTSDGCLQWTQRIPQFDILAPSVNIVLHYEISALSGNFGKIIKRVIFNPWDMYRNKSKFSGNIDMTNFSESDWPEGQNIVGKENVIAALKGELINSTAQLWVDAPKIEVNEKIQERAADYNKSLENLSVAERKIRKEIDSILLKQSGINMNVNLAARPFVRVTDSTGNPYDFNLTTGKFKVYMSLIAKGAGDDDKKYLLTSDVHSLTGRSTAFTWDLSPQGLQASIPLLLKQRTEFGRVSLLMKIEPVSLGLRKVKPFMAVYNLGEYDSWVRSQTPQIDRESYEPLNEVNYDKYLGSVEGLSKSPETLRDAERFYFGPFAMRFVRIMPGESATDRTLQYRVETCIEMGLDGRRVGPGLQFEIKTKDQYQGDFTIRRQTNENGCLTWFGFLSHKYYRKEVLEKKTAEVKYLGTHSDKDQSRDLINTFEKKYTYYMNPWDEKWTFGWDERDMPENYPQEITEQRKTAPASKLFVADFRYETMGFRYSIDKYLNLKVKKSILLKVYPYVLKYNSIVLGRNGTEKLRDGVYLMKVALQKDYLDPSARGVRIYDSRLSPEEGEVETNIANTPMIPLKEGESINMRRPERIDMKMLEEKLDGSIKDLKVYSIIDQEYGEGNSLQGKSSNPMMVDENGKPVQFNKEAWASDEVLRQSQKQYISVQQKLVRVMGGMIITPVEFDIEDLRLMRIRNQFFIQLQTVDENKLRVATILDDTLNNMYKDWNFNEKYSQIYKALGETGDLSSEEIQKKLDELIAGASIKSTLSELAGRGEGVKVAQMKLFESLGLNQFKEGTPEYTAQLEDIKAKLLRILQYKANGLDETAAFRNDKRLLINSIIREMQEKGVQDLESLQASVSKEYNLAIDKDPFLKFMFAGGQTPSDSLLSRIIQERIKRAEASGDSDKLAVLNSLGIADFTSSPLTPSYSFDMIANDGLHEPHFGSNGEEVDDDGKSGLPARTFVGPLTFVFNTNGSSLRPTDILNENYCTTAGCEVEDVVAENKVPAEAIEGAINLDANGQLKSDFSQPIYLSGDSINAEYENSKYYGYLGEYFNMTVDDLIAQKKIIEEESKRKNESGSQIRNFTKTMRIKHTLLRDRPESRLKKIRYEECALQVPVERIEDCFVDLTDAEKEKETLSRNDFFNQLNNRKFKNPENDLNYYDQVNDRFYQAKSYYGIAQGNFTLEDVDQIINTSIDDIIKNKEISIEERNRLLKKHRGFQHRMCFVLGQNLFTKTYFNKKLKTDFKTSQANQRTLEELEKMCHIYVSKLYGYPELDGMFAPQNVQDSLNESNDWNIPHEDLFKFPPIVMERKARVYETTGRYVYRGGKSLNINLAASFNLSSSHGIKVSTTGTWKPYEMATGVAIAVGSAGAGIYAGMTAGAAAGTLGGPIGMGVGVIVGGLVGGIAKAIVGGFGLSRSTAKDESAGRTQGINVSSGTFLVSQQATIDIELGEYERCLVVRYHDSFLRLFLQNSKQLKKDFNDDTDFDTFGVMICSGKPMNKCLPVKEKYYYFTQHFTEGDMLDTADLHNHPWLLQLRGIRDFMTFTASIGAREVDYIDQNNWLMETMSRTLSDASSFKINGTYKDNNIPEFEIADQSTDINWPLDELSRTYFNVLPTFPGIYSFYEEKPEWPYHDTNPGSSFKKCEQ